MKQTEPKKIEGLYATFTREQLLTECLMLREMLHNLANEMHRTYIRTVTPKPRRPR